MRGSGRVQRRGGWPDIAGSIALYRLPASATPATTENSIADRIEFGGDAAHPDTRSGIISIMTRMGKHQTELDAPTTDLNENQDVGFRGNHYTFEIVFDEASGTAGGLAILRNWARSSAPVQYPYGDIGVRNNLRPEFNLRPSAAAGYKVMDFTCNQIINEARVLATLTLGFGGDPAQLGA